MKRTLLVLLLGLTVILAGCGGDDDENGGESAGGTAGSVELVATEFAFDPADVSVDAGTVTFRLSNEGEFPHALEIEGGDVEEESDQIDGGASTELTVDLEPGEYEFYCPVGDHRERGMEGTLVVGGTASSGGYDYDR